jgi:3-phosphoshikimate 1-carboxyvinyltransferase
MSLMHVSGTLRVPGDKSISHRALMLAALASGPSRVTRILQSADVHSTAGVLRGLGVAVPTLSQDMVVPGLGPAALRSPAAPLDCGNSGTTTRLVAGIVAGAPVTATFVGDASLSRRPMRRVAEPLQRMGARVDLAPHGGLPMTVHGGALSPVTVSYDGLASAQVRSAILLAALVGGVPVSVTQPPGARDHTERMLRARGAVLDIEGDTVRLSPSVLQPVDVEVPADPSSAAFMAALAAGARSGAIHLEGVCVNPTRSGFFQVLGDMGAQVAFSNRRETGGEPIADITVAPGALRGVSVGGAIIPTLIDELPLLACLAARASGATVIADAAELRVKESDRIAAVVANLRAVGVEAEELPDGMRITGSERPLSGRVVTHGDHRIAMAFGVLGALSGQAIEVDDRDCVGVSYPGFWADLDQVRSR